ncbi:MAG TPA: hypothetical protein VD907_02670 [Verrucomicrobiae bacterium]|nr:hypothetical protein [Verrucomicrobiae bacterium]
MKKAPLSQKIAAVPKIWFIIASILLLAIILLIMWLQSGAAYATKTNTAIDKQKQTLSARIAEQAAHLKSGEKHKKIDALTAIKAVAATPVCSDQPAWWQRSPAAAQAIEACKKHITNTTALQSEISYTTELLNFEEAITNVLKQASAQGTNKSPDDYLKQWQAALPVFEKMTVPEAAKAMTSKLKENTQQLTAAWQALIEADKNQNKQRYQEVLKQLQARYASLQKLSGDSKTMLEAARNRLVRSYVSLVN